MTTYYVATNGSNSNNGSEGSPWQTLNYATSQNLLPGDTVIVKAGVYNGSFTVTKNGSEAGGYLTFKSEVAGGAKIVSAGTNGIVAVSKHHIRIEGFDVTAVNTGINFSKCHHVEIVNNKSHDNAAQGIYIRQSEFLLIEGNEVYNNSSNNQANNSISVHFMENVSGDTTTPGYRCTVRGNLCYNNGIDTTSTDSGGIILDSNPTANFTPPALYTYPRLVENNICYLNGGPGIVILEALNTLVRNNTCWHNGRKPGAGGFTGNLVNRSDNVVWVNNITVSDKAYNANSPAVSIPSLASRVPLKYVNVEWYNNIIFNGVNGEDSFFANNGNDVFRPKASNGNLIGVNPLFISAPSNFEPASNSPAINGGTTLHDGGTPEDYEGTTRTGNPDIGALEAAAASTGSMAPNSVVCAMAISRGAMATIAADVGLPSPFVQQAVRTSSPAAWIGSTMNTVLNSFGPVTKNYSTNPGGHLVALFSMKPAP